MKDYFEGWKEKSEVSIPSAGSGGFSGNVIIRQPVVPIREQRQEEYMEDDEPTVLVSPKLRIQAFITRLKTGEDVEITKDSFVIGKSSEADYVVSGNPTVSRKHARIVKEENGYMLEDLNSSNHIFLEGKRMTAPVRLTDKTRFRLSEDEEFEFSIRVGW